MAMTAGNAAEGRTRTALVTGGTGGMGQVAGKLAADGYDVAVAYASDKDPASATVGEIEAQGRRGAALPPLERLGSSGDIAGVVSFLVGRSGRWVNGQVVYANGGLV